MISLSLMYDLNNWPSTSNQIKAEKSKTVSKQIKSAIEINKSFDSVIVTHTHLRRLS